MPGLAWIVGLGPVFWLVLGLVLAGLEIVLPGVYLLWFGIAALATGAIAYLAVLMGTAFPLAGQFVVFAVLAALAAYEGRRRFAGDEADDVLNTGARRLVGSIHTLDQPIANGRGRLRIGDSWWGVDGPDLPAGAPVRIVAVDGTRLRVALAE